MVLWHTRLGVQSIDGCVEHVTILEIINSSHMAMSSASIRVYEVRIHFPCCSGHMNRSHIFQMHICG